MLNEYKGRGKGSNMLEQDKTNCLVEIKVLKLDGLYHNYCTVCCQNECRVLVGMALVFILVHCFNCFLRCTVLRVYY